MNAGGKETSRPAGADTASWLHPCRMGEPREVACGGYTPDHPWYYKRGGTLIPFSDVPPSPLLTDISGIRKLPVQLLQRQQVLSRALSTVKDSLNTARERYEALQTCGMDAISEHDKGLAAMSGEPLMALYGALARCYCHVVYLKSQSRNLTAMMPPESPTGQLYLF